MLATMTDTMKNDFWKIPLMGKIPKYGYSTRKNDTHTKDVSKSYGVVCGKRNNITVIDLDTNKWDDNKEHPFITKFGTDYVKKFDTFTVKTVRGGYHLYFTYDDDIKQMQNADLEIDVPNDF